MAAHKATLISSKNTFNPHKNKDKDGEKVTGIAKNQKLNKMGIGKP
jgi:hypothetical protein